MEWREIWCIWGSLGFGGFTKLWGVPEGSKIQRWAPTGLSVCTPAIAPAITIGLLFGESAGVAERGVPV